MDQLVANDIFDYIKKSPNPVSKRELSSVFNTKGPKRISLKSILKDLLAEKKIIKYNGKFIIPKEKDIQPKSPAKIERPTDFIVGLVEEEGSGLFLIPSDRRLRLRIPIASGYTEDLKNGHIVQAYINKQGRTAIAEVKNKLGSIKDPNILSKIAIYDFKLKSEFSEAAIQQAREVDLPSLKDREDLRDISLVTIDDESARDFDDAVWAQPDQEPNNPDGWHVIVAIADVAYYVRRNTALDQTARERGNSVYLPDCVIPMLPEGLSNDMCSLRPNEDRACLAVHLYFDAYGEMTRYRFCRGLMRSHARLTYNIVQGVIDGSLRTPPKGVSRKFIQTLYDCYHVLRAAREKRGALDLDIPETKLIVDEKGQFQQIGVRQRLPAHELIEEFMIAANVAAATFVENKQIPLLYRTHDKPSSDKILALEMFLKRANIKIKLGEVVTPHILNDIICQADETRYGPVIQDLILRSQAQAFYTPENIGHYGLGLEKYCHFTSPIRRYADLIVHRGILRALGVKSEDALSEDDTHNFKELSNHLSDCERRAAQAERDTQDRYMSQYLQYKVGDIFDAIITGIAKFGLFATIREFNATGILLAANLPGDYYVYDEKNMRMIGRRKKKKYELGQPIRVRLVKAEPHTGSLEFTV